MPSAGRCIRQASVMPRLAALCLLLVAAVVPAAGSATGTQSTEKDFRNCEDVLVDDVIEMAFGDQGQPFTGKVRCYYDAGKRFVKSERVFDEGIAIGSHHCFYRDGPLKYTLMYKNGKRHKLGSEFFTRRFSTTNEGGHGYRYGSIYIIPGEYREFYCRENSSSVDHCLKSSWIHCF